MYVGDQWVAWDGTQLFEPELEDWRAKVVDNRIQPAIRTEIAKMTKTEPTWTGIPADQSDDSISAARYAELAMEDAWKRHNLHRKLRAALLWARVATLGYWKVCWDPTVGKNVDALVNRETGRVARTEAGGPVTSFDQIPPETHDLYEQKTVSMGEVHIGLRNFFEVFPDPHATEEGLSSCEWIGEKAVYTRDWVARHFPDHVDTLFFDQAPSAGVGRGRYAFSRFKGTATANQRQVQGTELCEYWSASRHVVWSPKAKLVLLEEPNPYPWLPYVAWRGTPVPGQFYPDCITTQLVPRQVSMNKFLSQIEENAERIGNPPLLRPSSMSEDDFPWNGWVGEEVVYNDTGSQTAMPSFMQLPELPAYVQNLPAMAEKSMMEISGQHEVTSGQVPAGVTAASAIQLLQEQDDTRLGPDIAEMKVSLQEAAQRVLWIIGHYYTDERHLRVAGDDGTWDIEAFKGSFLRGHTEIEAQVGSGLPLNKAARQAAIQQMMTLFLQAGVPLEPRAMRKILSQMEVGGLEQFFATEERDLRQVQEENRKLALGAVLDINAYDNDEFHVAEHEDFQKTARYSRLPADAKANFEAHVTKHRDRMDDMAMAQMQGMPQGPPTGMPPMGPPSTGGQQPPSSNGSPPPTALPSA